MHDIGILENEWKQYRRKKHRPWILIIIGFVLVAALLAAFYNTTQWNRFVFYDKKKKQPVKKSVVDETMLLDGPLVDLETKEKEVTEEEPLVEVAVEDEEDAQPKKRLQIKVVETDDESAFMEVAKRFRLGHDVDDSLFLAKSYYAIGDYKKAEYWALQTNKVDENIEESWLIFIKAKIKGGQKNEALRILNAYIERTNSVEAKVLRERIEKGKL